MLEELVVHGLGAIDRAEVALGSGLSALTGETGAGKTLLVSALELLTGARADRSRVREGAREAIVEGRFQVSASHGAAALLAAHDLVDPAEAATVEVVVTRTVPSDGRAARARVNGRMVTAGVLAELGALLVEIAGQHEQQALASGGAQRRMLDAFAGPDVQELAEEVRSAVRAAADSARRLEEIETGERERAREIDVLRFEVSEIEGVAPEPGETDRLKVDASRLEHASTIVSALAAVRRALKGDGGAVELAASATEHLSAAAELDPTLTELHKRLEDAVYELEDVAATTGSIELDGDPAALERTRDRIGELNRLARKYGVDETAILEYLEKARGRLAELEATSDSLEQVAKEAALQADRAEQLAATLTSKREEAVVRLQAEIEPLLAELALPGARFEIGLEGCDLYEGGRERVEFRVAANPGEAPRPLGKVASGGELSRIALALHVLTGAGATPTLVFDEVDAGVGGEAAQSVGRALSRLAEERAAQVLVVTHLPQVASWADAQYRVVKGTASGRAAVTVEPVAGSDRVEELSRMLAGMPESDSARLHAEELLEIAGRSR